MNQNNKINAYELRRFIKIILFLFAILISIITLLLSQRLVNKIAAEESKKMSIWADAERILSDPNSEGDLGFHLSIVQANETIPAILVSESGRIIQYVNLGEETKKPSKQELLDYIEEFSLENKPIDIPIDETTTYKVYFGKSSVLKQLEYYPLVVLAIVALFVLVSYFAFSYSTKSEQNQVWVGLAKETAHQLGTPISSLMGWVECIDNNIIPENAGEEMRKDVDRLKIITERFSKIGSEPVLELLEMGEIVERSLLYMKNRISSKIELSWELPKNNLQAFVNENLLNWVIENLVKNSVDAMDGVGSIQCKMQSIPGKIYIDITDTGKGIPRNQMKDIFKPGFTSKKRGWGLGLSLAKRIIEDYHKGQIFVKESRPNLRTTIRIILNQSQQNDS